MLLGALGATGTIADPILPTIGQLDLNIAALAQCDAQRRYFVLWDVTLSCHLLLEAVPLDERETAQLRNAFRVGRNQEPAIARELQQLLIQVQVFQVGLNLLHEGSVEAINLRCGKGYGLLRRADHVYGQAVDREPRLRALSLGQRV